MNKRTAALVESHALELLRLAHAAKDQELGDRIRRVAYALLTLARQEHLQD